MQSLFFETKTQFQRMLYELTSRGVMVISQAWTNRSKSALAVGVIVGFFSLQALAVAAPSPLEIMTKSKEAIKVKSITSDAILTTGDKVKSFHWWRKLADDGRRFNTLLRFDAPAEVRGEGVLFLEYENDENDVLIYLPAYKKVRRVENQQQSKSFMASEMSYSDISNPRLSDFKYKLIKTEPCETFTCYVIEAEVANDKIKERTGYSHKTLWIRTDSFVEVKTDFYDTSGELVKVMTATQFEKFKTLNKWMATEFKFTNAKTKKVSSLKFSNLKANAPLDDSIFTEQNLAQGK